MGAIAANARELMQQFGPGNPADPSVLFALPNEVRYGANLYGFQKTYEGHWSVDIFFDSESLPSKLDGTFSPVS